MNHIPWILLAVIVLLAVASCQGPQGSSGAGPARTPSLAAPAGASTYAQWKNGPPKDPNWFPLAVWLQEPNLAGKYKAIGINTYVALWEGPTEEQLAVLKKAGMLVFVEENEVARKHVDDPTIIGWMHGDEPDNAQSLGDGKGYGPPVAPDKIVSGYERIRSADPSRPVILNLGQGVAWDHWFGRGPRSNHPEDYPEYVKGCDIVSFDIYPVTSPYPEVKGNLWYVANGVDRLVTIGGGSAIDTAKGAAVLAFNGGALRDYADG